MSTTELELTQEFPIENYLCKRIITEKGHARGKCIACGTDVAWKRDRVKSHKNANCTGIDREEKRQWLALSKIDGEEDGSDDNLRENPKKLKKTTKWTINKTSKTNRFLWDDATTLQLIDMFEENVELWNVRHDLYKNIEHKESILVDIGEKLGFELSEVQCKLHNLRSQYNTEVRKLRVAAEEGKTLKAPSWKFFNRLKFLSSGGGTSTRSSGSGQQLTDLEFLNEIKTESYENAGEYSPSVSRNSEKFNNREATQSSFVTATLKRNSEMKRKFNAKAESLNTSTSYRKRPRSPDNEGEEDQWIFFTTFICESVKALPKEYQFRAKHKILRALMDVEEQALGKLPPLHEPEKIVVTEGLNITGGTASDFDNDDDSDYCP